MRSYPNFELFGSMATLCHFQLFQKYLLRMRNDKRQESFYRMLNECLNNDKFHQHAKNWLLYFLK